MSRIVRVLCEGRGIGVWGRWIVRIASVLVSYYFEIYYLLSRLIIF